MNRELTSEEKRLIEREFVAKQEAAEKRRSFSRSVFLVGVFAGGSAAFLRGFAFRGPIPFLLYLAWIVCVLIYVGGQILPLSFSKDIDPRWHLNPWKDALSNLSEGRTLIEAIALLAGPRILQIVSSLVFLSFK